MEERSIRRRDFIKGVGGTAAAVAATSPIMARARGSSAAVESLQEARSFDVVVVGGTPGGIMAAIGAAREGRTALLLERTSHVGGLPANGLGQTDIATRGATGGLFMEFINRVYRHYSDTYGEDSPQVEACSDGYRFEPSVAEKIFEEMLAEHPRVTVLRMRQFDADPENVRLERGRVARIQVADRATGQLESYRGKVFIDATYEGDLAAAAGADYRLGREAAGEFNEPMAGKLYKHWRGPVGPGSTGLGDNAVQGYNYRLPLTRLEENKLPIPKPENYNREEFASLVEDIKSNRLTTPEGHDHREMAFDGIGRVVNMIVLPNGITDANNQHAAFISTDLPEENWPWPTAGWDWRDRYAKRLREYTLGLLWFAQNDPELPEDFRRRCREWGLAKSEYLDNENFPRQVYVREGRRTVGEYLFTAHDALPVEGRERPPIHATSVTASHYPLDSHAVLKREPGRVHLDGFFSYPTRPYTVPFGVIVPKHVDGLLIPVPVSGTHIGFSTLRMEPCWMALGHAAGVAAALAIDHDVPVRRVDMRRLHKKLVQQEAVLIHFRDVPPGSPHFEAFQHFGLKGWFPDYEGRPDEPVSAEDASRWIAATGRPAPPEYRPGVTTRGEVLTLLHRNEER